MILPWSENIYKNVTFDGLFQEIIKLSCDIYIFVVMADEKQSSGNLKQ